MTIPDTAALVDTWLQQALTQLGTRGHASGMTTAALFGVRLRTQEPLLDGDDWQELLSEVPHPDDTVPSSRDLEARVLSTSLEPLLTSAEDRLRARIKAFREFCDAMAPITDATEIESIVQLVHDIDALSRIAVYVTWLVDTGDPIDAPEARSVLKRIEALMDCFGRQSEWARPAEELIWAVCASVSEAVLSSDGMTSIRQQRRVHALLPHHRAARQSAMCFAAARARLYWHAVDAATAHLIESHPSMFAIGSALRRDLAWLAADMRQDLGVSCTRSTPEALDECSRWSFEAQRRLQSREQRIAATASALILRPRALAAADARMPGLGLRLRWSAVEGTDRRSADCHLHEGLGKAAVTFYRGDDLDVTVNGTLVSWLGLTVTASDSRALFDLDRLRADVKPSDLLSRLAVQMATLWVDNSPWMCSEIVTSGSGE